jgi:hypothetical protein
VIYVVFGVLLLILETLQWVGVLRSDPPLLPAAFSIGVPVFFVVMGLSKVKPIERLAIVVFGLTIFVSLNRGLFGLNGWAAPIVYLGAAYLIVFGRTHGSQLGARPKTIWVIIAFVVTMAAVALVIFVP